MQFIILGITFLILIVNALVGLFRGMGKALLRLVTLVLALVGAFLLAKFGSSIMAERLVQMLEEAVASNPNFAAFLQDTPVVGQSVGVLAQMLAAPILFWACYVLLKMITWPLFAILSAIFCHKSQKKKRKPFPFRRLIGAALGLVAGCIGVLVFVTPVMGYTALFSETISQAQSLDSAAPQLGLGEYNDKYLAPAATTPVASALYDGIGSKLFDNLTEVPWGDTTATLKGEWFAVVDLVENAATLGASPVAEYGEKQSAAVHAMAADIGESRLLSALGSGALNGIANAWLSDQSFAGIGKPDLGDESVEIILDGLLRVFATTTPELIDEDMDFFADIFDLFIKYQMFAKMGEGTGSDDLVSHLATSGFLAEARMLLVGNERMEPVVVAISDAGMRLLVRQLGDPAQYLEQHSGLMNQISDELKKAVGEDGKLDTGVLTQELNQVLAEHEVSIPEDATQIIAEGLSDEFTGEELTNLSVEEITDRLIDRFATVDGLDDILAAVPQQ